MPIRDPGWKKFGSGMEKTRSRIRDKHPGSATLVVVFKSGSIVIQIVDPDPHVRIRSEV
jgi:hypothetical protein